MPGRCTRISLRSIRATIPNSKSVNGVSSRPFHAIVRGGGPWPHLEVIVAIFSRWLAMWAVSLALAGSVGAAAQTLKERLSDKASDEQRIDNCGVPTERRGTKPRPDCPISPPSPSATRSSATK
jgi:hypothetical protein